MNCHCRKRKCKRQLSLLGSASFPAPKLLGPKLGPQAPGPAASPIPLRAALPFRLAGALTQIYSPALAGQQEHLQKSFRNPVRKLSEALNQAAASVECVRARARARARAKFFRQQLFPLCFAQLKSWHLIQNVFFSPS